MIQMKLDEFTNSEEDFGISKETNNEKNDFLSL